MSDALVVNEIYLSLQGESSFAGLPCVFVRLTACNLRCSYCDTAYAFTEGEKTNLPDIRAEVHRLAAPFSSSLVAADVRRLTSTGLQSEAPHDLEAGLGVGRPPAPEPRGGDGSSPLALPSPPERGDEPSPPQFRGAERDKMSAGSYPIPLLLRGGEGAPVWAGAGEGAARFMTSTPGVPPWSSCPVGAYRLPLVEFTGGEPLLQTNVLPLMEQLCDDGFTVLIETSGAQDISQIDPRVRRIMDLKCPSSGEVARNRWENLPHLKATDEIKFVIGTVEDYEWTKQQIAAHLLAVLCPLLVSWVSPLLPQQQDHSLKKVPAGQTPITRQELAERVLADALPVRVQLQLHKFIWPPDQRGV